MMESKSILPELESPALHTDLYEITMSAGYFTAGRANEIAHFELFIRGLAENRNFYLFSGLSAVIDLLERWRFTAQNIDYLRSVPALTHLPNEFFAHLAGLRFTGDLYAMPEGTVVFPNEPILRVRAPIIEAQLLETALLAIVNHQTTIATKAARVVHAARGRRVVEFGARRAHGLGAAAWGARAAYIGGCAGTSNCYAGARFGIPVFGTVAHSWIMSFDSEIEAFEAYSRAFPKNLLLLIDTYDTLEGARIAARFGDRLAGVRLDSGDLRALSVEVRRILDEAGLRDAMIFASGDLNENRIAALLEAGAPIDAFGVGSELITSRDEPTLGGVYKLVAVEDADGAGITLKRKLSAHKATIPGPKQVMRVRGGGSGADECNTRDVICLDDETEGLPPNAQPLLRQYFDVGTIIRESLPAFAIQGYAASDIARFDPGLLSLDEPYRYPVELSERLAALMRDNETTIHLPNEA
jgi:nicotinate phosphoribosyltransferase